MAKILLLIVVLVATIIVTAAAEATPSPVVPEQSSAGADKTINDVNLTLKKVFDDVIATAPPAKKQEAMDATSKQLRIAERALAKAKAGGEEKVARLALSYELKAKIVMEAPPAGKLERMEELSNAMAAPDHKDCASGGVDDKPFCETVSKLQRAFNEIRAAVAQGKKEESIDDVFLINQEFGPSIKAINKAYADGDEKEIAAVLATYDKCADVILAAPPAEKFKVMQNSIADASRASGKVEQPPMSGSVRYLLEPKKPDCPSACKVRCGRNWKNEMCMKMCSICCNKCSCVPPGTGQDTRHLCPCYDKMVNPKTGKPKCP